MARHTQKVNYEAVERKDNYGGYGQILTYLQKHSPQECHYCLTAIEINLTAIINRCTITSTST